MSRLTLALLTCGAFAASLSVATNSTYAAVLAVGLVMTGIEIQLLTQVAGGFTVAAIPILTASGTFLATPLWSAVEANAIVSYYRFTVSEETNIQIALIGMAFSAAYTVGALTAGPRRAKLSFTGLREAAAKRLPDAGLIGVGYIAILLAVYGFQDTLLQGSYLESRGPSWAVVLSTAGIPLAVLALSMVASKPSHWRGLALIGIFILFVISFARAGRVLALLPALILFGWSFASQKRLEMKPVILAIASTAILLPIPLAGRINPEGIGLIPLLDQLFTRPQEVLAAFSLSGLAGNVLVSGPLAATVAGRPIDPQAFWISVNPLPGTLSGWNEIKDSLRLTPYTPYNTLGELAAHGWPAFLSFACFSGFALALSTRAASHLRGTYQLIATLLILAITIRFSLTILQYNLRSSARLIWWTILGVTAIWTASVAFGQDAGTSQPGSRSQMDRGPAPVGARRDFR